MNDNVGITIVRIIRLIETDREGIICWMLAGCRTSE